MSFSYIKRAFGNISVKEENNIIFVEGVPADTIQHNIAKNWKTSTIHTNMFRHIGSNSFSFPSFFAPEVAYILAKLIEKRSRFVDVRSITKIINLLKENTWLSKTLSVEPGGRLDFSLLKDMNYQPLEHQIPWFEYYNKIPDQYGLNGALMNVAAGGGKTLMSLMTLYMAKMDYVIIICPKNAVQRVWESTIAVAFKKPPTQYNSLSPKNYNREKYAVFHYETMDKALTALSQMNGNVGIVLDESHNLTDLNTLRTDLFLKLCEKAKSKNIIFASGTPIG